MFEEANKALVRRYYEEVWNQGNLALIDELIAPDMPNQATPRFPVGPEGIRMNVEFVRAGLPDLHTVIDDMIAEGDRVVVRWTDYGTHTGPLGPMRVPPTGRSIVYRGINIYRIAGGKIVEDWGEQDMIGLMQQLGMLPPNEAK